MSIFWKDTIPEGYYDNLFANADFGITSIQTNWHKATFKNVKKFVSSTDVILDYACGSGNFFGSFQNLKDGSTGVDISLKQVKYANKKYGNKAIFKTLDEFEIDKYKKNFNTITCLGLIEFIEKQDIEELMNKFYDSLKNDGKLILTTPNFTTSMKILEKIINKYGEVNYKDQYKNRFIINDLENILLNSPFKNVIIKKIITPFIFLSFFNNKLGLRINSFVERILKNKFGYLFIVVLEK
tara:strand:- start:62 stop:781 length:720 start_codon:yes stop_codon:yes gene_type:complete